MNLLEGDVGAFITATGLINGLAVDVLPKAVFAPPVINVPNGTTLNLTDVSGYDMDFLAISDPNDVSGFEGTGTYEVTLESIGTSTLSTSGGNMDASQRTEATARLTVQYKVLPVPEPAAWAFLVMGLVGIHWLRLR